MPPIEWEVLDRERPLLAATYTKQRIRMVAFGLRGGGLAVVSPGSGMDEAAFEALLTWGEVRAIVAPNHFHNFGIAPWAKRFPGATVHAHPRALPRLRKKAPGVELRPIEELTPRLPDGVRIFGPPMAKQGESWVSLPTARGRAWCVCDGFLNEESLPGGLTGFGMKLVGFRTGLIANPLFQRLFVEDLGAWRAWARAELEADRPQLFVPAHGALLEGPDLPETLAALVPAG